MDRLSLSSVNVSWHHRVKVLDRAAKRELGVWQRVQTGANASEPGLQISKEAVEIGLMGQDRGCPLGQGIATSVLLQEVLLLAVGLKRTTPGECDSLVQGGHDRSDQDRTAELLRAVNVHLAQSTWR